MPVVVLSLEMQNEAKMGSSSTSAGASYQIGLFVVSFAVDAVHDGGHHVCLPSLASLRSSLTRVSKCLGGFCTANAGDSSFPNPQHRHPTKLPPDYMRQLASVIANVRGHAFLRNRTFHFVAYAKERQKVNI